MKAIVLAAGYATRLYPLTKAYPKPLLKVGSRHIIDYIIEKLDRIDQIDQIIVITNSKFFPHFKKWSRGLKLNKPLKLVDDRTKSLEDRRGAIGDMDFAIKCERLKDDLMVIGGDNLFNTDLDGFLAFACGHPRSPAIGTYDIGNKKEATKYGVVKLDRKERVADFQEKPKTPKSTLVAMCLYYFPGEKLGLIKEYLHGRANKHDATGFYIDWLRKRVNVYGYVFKGKWYDIGDHKFYNEAKERFNLKKED